MAKATNSIILRHDLELGKNSAENDDAFLFECFINLPILDELLTPSSSRVILAGRTGAGKTALLRKIDSDQEHVRFIDLTDISLTYISNSDIFRFLQGIGANLDILFQVLWKHILVSEYIKLRYGGGSLKWSTMIDRLADKFSGQTKRKTALEYLKQFEEVFWKTSDQPLRAIVKTFENKLSAVT